MKPNSSTVASQSTDTIDQIEGSIWDTITHTGLRIDRHFSHLEAICTFFYLKAGICIFLWAPCPGLITQGNDDL